MRTNNLQDFVQKKRDAQERAEKIRQERAAKLAENEQESVRRQEEQRKKREALGIISDSKFAPVNTARPSNSAVHSEDVVKPRVPYSLSRQPPKQQFGYPSPATFSNPSTSNAYSSAPSFSSQPADELGRRVQQLERDLNLLKEKQRLNEAEMQIEREKHMETIHNLQSQFEHFVNTMHDEVNQLRQQLGLQSQPHPFGHGGPPITTSGPHNDMGDDETANGNYEPSENEQSLQMAEEGNEELPPSPQGSHYDRSPQSQQQQSQQSQQPRSISKSSSSFSPSSSSTEPTGNLHKHSPGTTNSSSQFDDMSVGGTKGKSKANNSFNNFDDMPIGGTKGKVTSSNGFDDMPVGGAAGKNKPNNSFDDLPVGAKKQAAFPSSTPNDLPSMGNAKAKPIAAASVESKKTSASLTEEKTPPSDIPLTKAQQARARALAGAAERAAAAAAGGGSGNDGTRHNAFDDTPIGGSGAKTKQPAASFDDTPIGGSGAKKSAPPTVPVSSAFDDTPIGGSSAQAKKQTNPSSTSSNGSSESESIPTGSVRRMAGKLIASPATATAASSTAAPVASSSSTNHQVDALSPSKGIVASLRSSFEDQPLPTTKRPASSSSLGAFDEQPLPTATNNKKASPPPLSSSSVQRSRASIGKEKEQDEDQALQGQEQQDVQYQGAEVEGEDAENDDGGQPEQPAAGVDDIPVGKSVNGGMAASVMASAADGVRVSCPTCSRMFAEASLAKHKKVCVKVFQRKRKEFKVEIVDAKELAEVSVSNDPAPVVKKRDWRAEREQLRSAMNASKDVAQAIKDGKPLPPVVPSNPDLDNRTPCPHCKRKFAADTAERHIPKCPSRKK